MSQDQSTDSLYAILDALVASDQASTTPQDPFPEDLDSDEELTPSEKEELQAKIDEDEEPFDPENPNDLSTAAQKAASDEDEEETGAISLGSRDSSEDDAGGDEEEEDSFINDEEDDVCPDHELCVTWATKLDQILTAELDSDASRRERVARLCEVLCDCYRRRV